MRCTRANFRSDPGSLAGRRAFSQSATRRSYESTIKNLLIHKDTKVLCQGFTGKTVCLLRSFCCLSARPLIILVVGVRTGNFPREGSAGVWHQDGRRRFPEESWPDAPRLASVRVCEGGISYLRHVGNTAAINLFLHRPFARPNPTPRSCTCRPRTLPMRSLRQSRMRLASLCALRRASLRRTKSEYVSCPPTRLSLVPTAEV